MNSDESDSDTIHSGINYNEGTLQGQQLQFK